MGGACDRYEGEMHTEFWWVDVMERGHSEDLGVDERIILRWIFRNWDVGGIGWIELTQDRDRWLALVNAVMNLRFP